MGKHKSSKHRKEKSRSRSRSRKRHYSSSSNSTDSDDSDRNMEKKLKNERIQKKIQKKLEKEKLKANETIEEKKLRRMNKKKRKEEKRMSKSKNDCLIPSELAYTNLNNPFNDTKLTETFIWGKKLEKEGKLNMSTKKLEIETRQRIQKNLHEAAELKRIRDARLAAKEDMDMIARDNNIKEGMISDEKEKEFNMNLIKERSRIRIEQGRAKAIDVLTRYMRYVDEINEKTDAEFELEDPITCIKTYCKSLEDLDDLLEDIRTYQTLETSTKNITTWNDIVTIVKDEISKKEYQDSREVHASVKQEALKLFKDKSVDELCKLENQIVNKLHGNASNKGYWQDLHDNLKVFIARKRLKEFHGQVLKLKLSRIREEQMKEVQLAEKASIPTQEIKPVIKQENSEEYDATNSEQLSKKIIKKVDISKLENPELDDEQKEHKWRLLKPEQLEEATIELYKIGCYSPPYNKFDDTMPGIEIIEAQLDAENLLERREKNRKPSEGATNETDAKMLSIARKGMEGDEAIFSVEEQLETQKHLWSDKYRPRKPTYLNRVQTGFDWNKYNQTHYDMDNPPPKIVQGYKFNIFYPDLLDPSKPPTFTITPCDDPDFAIVRFKAGPPYEDIAFKVVNREWEILHKNGYKCQFQNGVFQLWFTFKRYRYRR